jgi:glutathione S-transferase
VRARGLERPRAEVDDDFERHLAALGGLAHKGGFLTGAAIAGADLAAAAQLQSLRVGLTPDAERLIGRHAATRAWLDRVVARCGDPGGA